MGYRYQFGVVIAMEGPAPLAETFDMPRVIA
jgi:hypothetical protein